MKKYLAAIVVIFVGLSSYGQVRIGLKVSPNLSWSKPTHTSDSTTISGNGLKLRSGAGIIIDLNLSDNFAFATGLGYNTKGAGYKVSATGLDTSFNYSLQYLEIPISIKVFTNEIMDYTKMYFQVGVTQNINIAAKVNKNKVYTDGAGNSVDFTNNIRTFETSLLVAAGIEMEMGETTSFLAGLSYNRGLSNIDATGTFVSPNKLANEYLALDIGLKF